MKKNAANIVFITLLLSSILAGAKVINKVKAETLGPIRFDINSTGNVVEILFPQNETYNISSILVDFTVEMGGTAFDFGYSLDGGPVERIVNVTKISESGYIPYVTYYLRGSIFLANLSEGTHSVTVYQGVQYRGIPQLDRYEVSAYAYVNFSIDLLPIILMLSPEAKIYNTSSISLNFAVNEPNTQVAYSLDGRENATISGNTTLTELANGVHNVTVYTWDAAGNIGTSETVTFTVAKPETIEPFPTAPVAAAFIAFVAIAGAGLLFYFKKRKR